MFLQKFSTLFAATLIAATAAPASAQSLDQIIGYIAAGSAYGYDSCAYVRRGVSEAICQVNRAANVANTLRNTHQRETYRQRERFEQRARQLQALQRACRAGDTQSCARSGGTSEQQMQIARALMDACSNGDQPSCRRVEAIMSQRDVAFAYGAPRRELP